MASTAVPFAFVQAVTLNPISSATQFDLAVSGVAGDGVNTQVDFAVCYCWDVTLPVATNIANLKAALVNMVASEFGITLQTSDVSLFLAVN